jgi:hypothetical protein
MWKRVATAFVLAGLLVPVSASPSPSPQPAVSDVGAAPTKTEIEKAFRAAYGRPSPVVAQTPEGIVTFRPGGLVDVDQSAGVVALVSLGENHENCHACSGSLSVHYLKHTASGFKPWGKVDDYGFTGNGFGAPPNWSIRRDLEDYPVLAIQTGYTGQGCTSAQQDLVALTPEGVELRVGSIPILYNNSASYHAGDPQIVRLEGEVRPLLKNKRFEVVYHGTKFLRLVYERKLQVYVTHDQKPDTC